MKNITINKISTQNLFGAVMFINYIVYFFIFDYQSETLFTSIFLRSIASILCFILIFIKYTPPSFWKQIYWYTTLTYCLPFFFTFMSLTNHLSIIWLMNSLSALFFLIILLDLKIFLKLFTLGSAIAIILYKYILLSEVTFIPTSVSLGDLLATYFAALIIVSLFAFKRDAVIIERNEHTDLLNKLNNSLDQRTEALAKALAVKSEFLNNLNHEIRTPIQGIMGIAEGLDNSWLHFDDKQKHKYTHEIANNAKRLTNFVENILDLSNFNDNKVFLQLTKTDLKKLIFQIIEECKMLYLNGKDITIEFTYSLKHTESIMLDAYRITQVIHNLLVNAIKYSSSNTKINIRLFADELIDDNQQKLSALHFIIKDQGMGIPANELQNIFIAFAQSSRTKNNAGGSGLGLTIAKKIIELHHGQIWAENNYNKIGSSFHFLIPIF